MLLVQSQESFLGNNFKTHYPISSLQTCFHSLSFELKLLEFIGDGLDLFRALGNQNRRSMLKLLLNKEFHISGLAKELGISVPVALKHAKVLESAGFIERSFIGNLHVLKIRKEALENLKNLWGLFEKPLVVSVKKNSTMLDALKKVGGISFSKTEKGFFVSAVDGKKDFYLYEVNGEIPLDSADNFEVKNDCVVELKRLVPVVGKKILLKVDK